jgi:predicted pyridoxine 5'-phosphate oxidase superfamily flavin-nucleotide-binding protein
MPKITPAIKKIIEHNALALATVDENKNPHCVAVGDVKVIVGDKFLIGDVFLVMTRKNLMKNPNVALVVWNRNWEEECIGYQFKGTAKYFSKGNYYEKAKKIHKGFPVKGAILVKVNKIKYYFSK